MTILSQEDLEDVLQRSECLITESEIQAAYDKLAMLLNLHYAATNPVILVLLNGGLIPAGQLLTKLSFIHRMDYIHATRYKKNKGTNELIWKSMPDIDLTNEHVLLIDDIFDEGVTLKQTVEWLNRKPLKSLKTCCLVNKLHDRKVDDFEVDFIGCNVEDRYIYGCGMDFHGFFRHLPGIYALKEE